MKFKRTVYLKSGAAITIEYDDCEIWEEKMIFYQSLDDIEKEYTKLAEFCISDMSGWVQA